MTGAAGQRADSAGGFVLERRRIDAVLLDLDGVLTDTASLHATAWRATFDTFLRDHAVRTGTAQDPFTARDYRDHVDGRPRRDGIRCFLASRGISLEEGTADDGPDRQTVEGLARAKNDAFHRAIARDGVRVLPGARTLLENLRTAGLRLAVVTASRNAPAVIEAAGLAGTHDVLIDGNVVADLGLPGKPAPHALLEAVLRLGVPAWRAAVVEDAASGIAAARAGGFASAIGLGHCGDADRLYAAGADAVITEPAALAIDAGKPFEAHPPPPMTTRDLAHLLGERRPALFLDYDGTLTPIVDRPENALLSAGMHATLGRLARVMPVAIVSGRGREDLAALVGLDTVVYAGAHGFDVTGPRGTGLRAKHGEDFRDDLAAAAARLRQDLTDIEGGLVEDKRFAVAVHYRLVAPAQQVVVEQAVSEVLERFPRLRRSDGKMVIELRPRLDWHKGRVVLWLIEALGLDPHLALPLYIGDDTTDEDALAAIRDRGLGILVSDVPRDSAAHCRLPDTMAVQRFLDTLAAATETGDA